MFETPKKGMTEILFSVHPLFILRFIYFQAVFPEGEVMAACENLK